MKPGDGKIVKWSPSQNPRRNPERKTWHRQHRKRSRERKTWQPPNAEQTRYPPETEPGPKLPDKRKPIRKCKRKAATRPQGQTQVNTRRESPTEAKSQTEPQIERNEVGSENVLGSQLPKVGMMMPNLFLVATLLFECPHCNRHAKIYP